MTTLTYAQTISEIESFGVMPERAPSLEPMRRVLHDDGLVDRVDPNRVIVVAGTNGKGSVCATLEALCLSTGAKVGLYTSPHLIDTTERIRINGADISRAEFVAIYGAIRKEAIERKLTHFEVLTWMAARAFFQNPLAFDWVILEVGLGGLWDATNAIPHRHCVVTQLGRDHENILGNTLSEIAANKFGIVGPGSVVTHAKLPDEVVSLARAVQERTQSKWIEAEAFSMEVEPSCPAPRFWIHSRWGTGQLQLPGPRGAANTALALTVFESLGYAPQDHLDALGEVRWPGRMSPLKIAGTPCPVFFSGDHNPQGAESLVELLSYYTRRHLHLLVGIGKDKDARGIVDAFARMPESSIYLTQTPFRGKNLEDYGPLGGPIVGRWRLPVDAMSEILRRAKQDDLVVVTGSLYLASALSSLVEP